VGRPRQFKYHELSPVQATPKELVTGIHTPAKFKVLKGNI